MLKALKTTVLGFSKACGLFALTGPTAWRRHRLLVLSYHSISIDDEHHWNPAMFMSPARFEARLDLLIRNKANVLPFADAVNLLRTGRLPPRSVSITFDDGTVNFYQRAFPVLRRFGFPALVYLTTWYAERPYPLYQLLCPYLLWRRRDRRLQAKAFIGVDREWDLSRDTEREVLAKWMYGRARKQRLTLEERQAQLRVLAERLDIDFDQILGKRLMQLMTPIEIAEIARSGVDVQLHTHRHRTPSDRDLFVAEILENRRVIEKMTGRSAAHFCYPSGSTDPRFLQWLQECGVDTATTCASGLVAPTTDALLMPRVVDGMGLSTIEFESWICGLGAILPTKRPALGLERNGAVHAFRKFGRWLALSRT